MSKAREKPTERTDTKIRDLELRLREEFQQSPTLSTYLSLRKKHPRAEFRPWLYWDLIRDEDFFEAELREDSQIDFDLYEKASDGDRKATQKLCLDLMALILDREKELAKGKVQLVSRGEAISDTLINAVAMKLLEDWARDPDRDDPIPEDLLVLIRHQLIGLYNPYSDRARLFAQKMRALEIAAEIDLLGGSASIGRVAKELGKSKSTVSRWFPDNTFQHSVKWMQEDDWFLDKQKERALSIAAAIDFFDGSVSIDSLATEMGVTTSILQRWFTDDSLKQGVEKRREPNGFSNGPTRLRPRLGRPKINRCCISKSVRNTHCV